MADVKTVTISLDEYFQTTPVGSLDKAIGNNLYGLNHRQTPGAVPSTKDTYGLTFFVRPQLNLQLDNVRNVRVFSDLLTNNPLTIQSFVRCSLDPRLIAGYRFGEHVVQPISSPVVDNENAFFSVMTNNLKALSGWPDIVAPTWSSEPGLYNESMSLVDGSTFNREVFTLDATFRNVKGDPILYMMNVWMRYASLVFEGILVPYPDFISENEIDYNTRIYRLVLDQQKDFVRKIAATGAAFPISSPTGSFFDFNDEKPYNDQNKDMTIRFQCMGAEYQDNILIYEFNETVCIFNESMRDEHRESEMIQVGKDMLPALNHRGYPRIDPLSNRLEWWFPRELFNARTKDFLNSNQAASTDEGD